MTTALLVFLPLAGHHATAQDTTAQAASAQNTTAQSGDTQQPPLWEFRFAAFGRFAPIYPGSADQNLTVLPLPYPVYRGARLRFGEDMDELATGRVMQSSRARLDINFNVNFGEDSNEIPVRSGMPDLDLLLEIGPELEINLTDRPTTEGEWLLSLQARAAISVDGGSTRGRGYLLNPELEYRLEQAFNSRNDLSFRWKSTWASEDYAEYYYEIAPAFETATRRAYDASSGYLGSEFRVGIERQITARLRFDGNAKLWINKGAKNRHSALFQDDYGFGIQAAFIWSLATSRRRGE